MYIRNFYIQKPRGPSRSNRLQDYSNNHHNPTLGGEIERILVENRRIEVEAGFIGNGIPRYTEEVEAHGGLLEPPNYVGDAGDPSPCYDA